MQETSHKIYDLLFKKHRHLPVVAEQMLHCLSPGSLTDPALCLHSQRHLGSFLPLQKVLNPFPQPNLKAFTPSPSSQLSPLQPVLCYILFSRRYSLRFCPVHVSPVFSVCFHKSSFNVYSHTLPPTSSAFVENVGVSVLIHGSVSPLPLPCYPTGTRWGFLS